MAALLNWSLCRCICTTLDGKVVLVSPVAGGLEDDRLADAWDCVELVGRLSAIVRCLMRAKAACNSMHCLS